MQNKQKEKKEKKKENREFENSTEVENNLPIEVLNVKHDDTEKNFINEVISHVRELGMLIDFRKSLSLSFILFEFHLNEEQITFLQ